MLTVNSTKKLVGSYIPPKGTWSLCESVDGEPSYDPEVYCARLRGPMAVIDGVSGNNRYYSRELWTQALRENQERLNEEGLFGSIGHEQKLDEDALSDGKITHKTTKLWINEETGTVDGEILVLAEGSGKLLGNYLRAGMKIAVSSRAFGTFKGTTSSGADIIDPKGFYLQGFDFVLNPGVEKAFPKLVESVTINEEQKMELNEKYLDNLKDLAKAQVELSESLRTSDKAIRDLNESKDANAKLQKDLNEANARLQWLTKNIAPKPIAAIKEINEGIAKWLMLPEFRAIAEEFGMFDTLGTTMEQTTKKLVESLKAYSKHGAPSKIAADKAMLEQYIEAGSTPEVINKSLDLLESFQALGKTPEEISENYVKAAKAIRVYNNARRVVAARKLVKEFGLHESKQASLVAMLKKMTLKEVRESLTTLKSAKAAPAAAKVPGKKVNESVPAKKTDKVVPIAKVPTTKAINESMGNAAGAMKLVGMMAYEPVTTKS